MKSGRLQIFFSAAFFLLILQSVAAAPSRAVTKPNIIFIFCDDLGYGDLGCYGNTEIRTPNIDRMASEGVRLTQFYVTMPACSPSRASLLTGRYQLRVGIPNVLGPESKIGLRQKEWTIAEALKEQGYSTTCIGKWHLGRPAEFLPTKHGFNSYFGIPYSNDMDRSHAGGAAVPLLENETIIEQPVNQDTLTQRYTERAIRYIQDNKNHPFFLYLPHTFPHVPLHASDKFRGKSARGLFGDVVEEIDWSMGEILNTLRALKLDRKTLVIFSSDNGPWLVKGRDAGSAGILRDGKATVYEGGIREPFIAWWPGKLAPGKTVDEPVISTDMFPTLLNLAGGKAKSHNFDGTDVWPIISEGARRAKTEFVWYKGVNPGAVRIGNYKLHLPKTVKGTSVPLELYDIAADISEKNNLAAAKPEVVERLSKFAAKMDDEIRGQFRRHPNAFEGDLLSKAPARIADPTSTAAKAAETPR
ncbi:MAG: sulfatase family protein [Candidatus Sumerlaeaceae bacterium]